MHFAGHHIFHRSAARPASGEEKRSKTGGCDADKMKREIGHRSGEEGKCRNSANLKTIFFEKYFLCGKCTKEATRTCLHCGADNFTALIQSPFCTHCRCNYKNENPQPGTFPSQCFEYGNGGMCETHKAHQDKEVEETPKQVPEVKTLSKEDTPYIFVYPTDEYNKEGQMPVQVIFLGTVPEFLEWRKTNICTMEESLFLELYQSF